MSTTVPRERKSKVTMDKPAIHNLSDKVVTEASVVNLGTTTSKLWRSEGHPVNRKTGKRDSGGPFHVSHTGPYIKTGSLGNALGGNSLTTIYSGPNHGVFVGADAIKEHHDSSVHDMDETSMIKDGAIAVSQCAPTNPTANLGTALAESFREGVPTLPGIQSWKNRTEKLRNVGSEYLNYQFGWAPLRNEVNSVVDAARYHRDIMQNYRHNEGRNVHRRFEFSPEITEWQEEVSCPPPYQPLNTTYLASDALANSKGAVVTCKNVRRRWFEGCFTYGGPAKAEDRKSVV